MQEGLQSWSEEPVRIQDPHSSDKIRKFGFLKLTAGQIADDPAIDTKIASTAIERMNQLVDDHDEPFFLAVGFR